MLADLKVSQPGLLVRKPWVDESREIKIRYLRLLRGKRSDLRSNFLEHEGFGSQGVS